MLRTPTGLSGPREVCVLCQRRAWYRCSKTCLLDRGEYANVFFSQILSALGSMYSCRNTCYYLHAT